jgi:hypothetical protein
MEMISQYLKASPQCILARVISIYRKQGLSGTPLMAMLIEDIGITRKTLSEEYFAVINDQCSHSSVVQAEAMLAYIIYLIDYQEFKKLGDLISRELT